MQLSVVEKVQRLQKEKWWTEVLQSLVWVSILIAVKIGEAAHLYFRKGNKKDRRVGLFYNCVNYQLFAGGGGGGFIFACGTTFLTGFVDLR